MTRPLALLLTLLPLTQALAQVDAPAVVEPTTTAKRQVIVTYDPAITGSFTGRVYLMLSRSPREPRIGPSWFDTEPFFALDVTGWEPLAPLIFDDGAIGYPGPLSEVPPATYTIQAVMRRNLDSPAIGTAPGTAYSRHHRRALGGDGGAALELRIDQVVEPRPLQESDRLKLIEHTSTLLSEFHGRPVVMRAAVILPEGFDRDSSTRYPAYYWIPGFGSTCHTAKWMQRRWDQTGLGDRIVRVVLDPSCYGGHHVFADSANNGPWAAALVRELIPQLETVLPLVPQPGARFLGGHSSGGWSSLWLQVAHPEFFGGVWSVAPDPVDFRAFQLIDLYRPDQNMYRDGNGNPRPIARQGTEPVTWYEDFVRMEEVYGDGGQVRSFEWVFSPRGPDGRPVPMFDRSSGQVSAAVAEAWKRYDIRLVLERAWPQLEGPLAGKIHVFTGELDNFYLDGATRLLGESLQRLGADAVVELVPGADHGSVATPALDLRIDREMITAYERATKR
jgi:hypothetical protein